MGRIHRGDAINCGREPAREDVSPDTTDFMQNPVMAVILGPDC